MGILRHRLLRFGLAAALGCTVALSGLGLYSVSRYRGLTLSAMALDVSFEESMNRLRSSRYWGEYLDKLRLDPVSGFYRFEDPDGLDSFERGRMSYHRGDFGAASGCRRGYPGLLNSLNLLDENECSTVATRKVIEK